MTIKAIVSDLGNVIVNVHWGKFCSKLTKCCLYSENEILKIVVKSGLKDDYERGDLTSEEFYKKSIDKINAKIDYKNFAKFWSDIFTPNKPIIDLLEKLKLKYPLILLSNTGKLHFEYIDKNFPIMSAFDGFVLSYKIGLLKPNPEIYHKAIKLAKCKPEECVYIDDIKEYSDAASKIGMNGINYTTTENLENELKELGVLGV